MIIKNIYSTVEGFLQFADFECEFCGHIDNKLPYNQEIDSNTLAILVCPTCNKQSGSEHS